MWRKAGIPSGRERATSTAAGGRAQRRSLHGLYLLSLGALALSSAGCEGCLGLDQYQLVPAAGGTAGAGGTGGADGCSVEGLLFVSAVQEASDPGGEPEEPCTLFGPTPAGIELRALDPERHECVARLRIAASEGTVVDSLPRIRFDTESSAYVTASFRGGSLSLAQLCDTTSAVVLEEPAGATDTLFVAKLRRQAEGFCVEWARRAWTTEPAAAGKLIVSGLDKSESGQVALTGSLGGGVVHFEDETSSQEVTGAAFFARYSKDGALAKVAVLAGAGPDGAALDTAARGAEWLITGTVSREQPACYACSGDVNVTEPAANACLAGGGAGGAGGAGTGGVGGMTGSGSGGGVGGMTSTGGVGGVGGMTSTGGVGGMTGTGGVGGMTGTGGVGGVGGAGGAGATTGSGGVGGTTGSGGSGGGAPDSQNAFLWQQSASGDACTSFHTFGSDHLADGDAQIGFGLSALPVTSGCTAYWAGLAGREAWRFGSSPTTSLLDAGGASMDGFIARFDGGDAIGCSGEPGPAWNLRLTPLGAAGAAVAERVSAERCGAPFGGVAATALVRSNGGGNLSLYRCSTAGGCESSASLIELSPEPENLVVLGLDGNGTADWSATFGPVRADENAAAGTFAARSHHDLARDSNDRVHVVFTTTGPLAVTNVNTSFDCEGLVENLAAGTYMVSLARYASGAASCDWVHRLGP